MHPARHAGERIPMKERIEQLLEQSVSAYERLLSSYREVEKAVSAGCDAEELEAIMARMAESAASARDADAAFQEIAADTGADLFEMAHFEKWLELLEAAAEKNGRVRKYIEAAMAMTRSDLSSLRKEKTAMAGYHGTRGYARTGNTGSRIRCGV